MLHPMTKHKLPIVKTLSSFIIFTIKLLRPSQWIKNLFIFLPLFFDRKLLDSSFLLPCFIAFVSFCFMSSAIYCLNDLIDIQSDRLHPIKCQRPIASGMISKSIAIFIVFLCALISYLLILCLKQHIQMGFFIITCYFLLNICYCLKLKQFAIIDVFIIAIGFVLRVFMGGAVSDVSLSHWIVSMTFLLALFLAFAKRRDDVVLYENTGVTTRNHIKLYNLPFMNQIISILASILMVCYILYTISSEAMSIHSPHLYLTAIFVLAGLIRYLQITIVDIKSGSPTQVLLHDRFVQVSIAGWIISFFIIIYL